MNNYKKGLLGLALTMGLGSAAHAAVVSMNFEGVNAAYPSGYAFVGSFYNGGTSSDGTTGPNFGIEFSDNAQAICLNTPGVSCSNTSRGGLGDPTSQLGALFFLNGNETFMNVAAGFETGFSFLYTAINNASSVSVFDDLNGAGNLLATIALPTTTSACGTEYGAGFCPFVAVGVGFSGIAKSVSFAGVANQVVFDDVTFGSTTPVPVPAALPLLAAGLGALTRYRRKALVA